MKKPFSFFLEEELINSLQEKMIESNCTRDIFEQLVLCILNNEIVIQNNVVKNTNISNTNTHTDSTLTQQEHIEEKKENTKILIKQLIGKTTNVTNTLLVPSSWTIDKDVMVSRSLLELCDSFYKNLLPEAKKAFKNDVNNIPKTKEHLIDTLCNTIMFEYFI